MKNRWIVWILLLIILGESMVLLLPATNKPSPTTPSLSQKKPSLPITQNDTKAAVVIADTIDHIGAAKTYELLKKEYQQSKPTIQHTAAHIFGDVLYKKEGIKGLVICDNSFAYGCYHSFMVNALEDHGLSIVGDLYKTCSDKYGDLGSGCEHGIGHGLVFVNNVSLEKAITICTDLSKKTVYTGCVNGVFMEYNLRTMNDGSGSSQARTIDDSGPFAPCDTLSLKFQKPCYFEQPHWWEQIYNHDYQKISSLCAQLQPESKKACFLGMGNVIAPFLEYNPSRIAVVCNSMPFGTDQQWCFEGAGRLLSNIAGGNTLTERLCSNQTLESKDMCLKNSVFY